MGYKNIEDERAYDREWKRQYRHDHPDEVRAADRTRHKNRTPNQLEARKEVAKGWRKRTPEKTLNRTLKSRYNITLQQYEELLVSQGGVCAICKKPSKSRRRFSLDHDHATGVLRGLVHQKCNTIIGLANDSIEHLQACVNYIAAAAMVGFFCSLIRDGETPQS